MTHSMRWTTALLVVLALLAGMIPAPSVAQGPPEPGHSVVRVYYRNRANLNDLAAWLDIWEVHPADEPYLVAGVSAAEFKALQAAGYRVETLPHPASGLETIPGYPCYRTIAELYADLSQIAADHPGLTELVDVGDSWDKVTPGGPAGHDLYVLIITNEALPGPKPRFFLMANIHGRELITPEAALVFIDYLTDNYGRDPDVTWVLDHREVHVMVSANPDGHVKNEPGEPWAWWRKNTNDDECGTGSYGVDLNRNASFKWGCCGGSSPDPCHQTYRGTGQASEPEEQVVEGYARSIFPDQRGPLDTDAAPITTTGVFITLHSYSNLVLWPWGHAGTPAPNSTGLSAIGRKFATYNGYTPQQSYGLYPTDGTTDDWCYGELGVPSFTFEIGGYGDGFYPPCSRYDALIQPNIPAFFYAAKIADTPYRTVHGPDAKSVSADPDAFNPGDVLTLSATIDDSQNGGQTIAAAEYFIDTPGDEGTGTPMTAADGAFDSVSENVTATVGTTGLSAGQHLLLVRGRDSAGNWGAFTATFINQPAMSIDKTAWPDPVAPGGLLTYTLTVHNRSAIPLSSMTITDAIPAHTALASATPTYTLAGGVIKWEGYAIPTWDSLVLTLAVTVGQVTSGTTISNDAYGAWCIEILTPTHGAPVTTLVQDPALRITKIASADSVAPSARLGYTLTVTSETTVPATGVVITDAIPADTTFAAATGVYSNGVVTWSGLKLAPGASLPVTLAVTVGQVASGTLITNDAYAAWCSAVPTPVHGALVTTLVQDPVLRIAKIASADSVAPSARLGYTLTVTSETTVPATGVVITDAIPADTTFAAATGVYSNGVVTWSGLSLDPGASLHVILAVTVGQVVSGTLITNDAYAAWCSAVPTPTHGAPVTTTVREPHCIYFPLVARGT